MAEQDVSDEDGGVSGRGRYRAWVLECALESVALLRSRGGARVGRRWFTARMLATLVGTIAEDEAELDDRFRALADEVFAEAWLDAEW